MPRIEENKILIDAMDELVRRKPGGTYQEIVTFQLGMVATMLGDISKSLAILADSKISNK